jgi:hypothetical protein
LHAARYRFSVKASIEVISGYLRPVSSGLYQVVSGYPRLTCVNLRDIQIRGGSVCVYIQSRGGFCLECQFIQNMGQYSCDKSKATMFASGTDRDKILHSFSCHHL